MKDDLIRGRYPRDIVPGMYDGHPSSEDRIITSVCRNADGTWTIVTPGHTHSDWPDDKKFFTSPPSSAAPASVTQELCRYNETIESALAHARRKDSFAEAVVLQAKKKACADILAKLRLAGLAA